MKQNIRTSGCIAAALALGGCQSFIGALGFGPKPSAQVEQRAEVFGSEELERGKLALRQGHVAMAIQQFRMAALNEDHAADAFNGLGVAYARLGRADLAERYFKSAMELDSANPKYAANLARFYDSALGNSARALAAREREAAAALAEAKDAAEAQGLLVMGEDETQHRGAVTVETPARSARRESGKEVQVSSARPQPGAQARRQAEIIVRAPANAQDAGPDLPEVATRRGSNAERPRISLVGRGSAISAPRSNPARITVTRAGGQSVAPRRSVYPVRIALRPAD